MTEQERKKAFENQRRNAERRAKEADGTYDMERRIQYEKKQREERRLQQKKQALKQRFIAAVIVVAALIVIAVLFRSCNKKDDKLLQTMPFEKQHHFSAALNNVFDKGLEYGADGSNLYREFFDGRNVWLGYTYTF